jgi:hypothetical protein
MQIAYFYDPLPQFCGGARAASRPVAARSIGEKQVPPHRLGN